MPKPNLLQFLKSNAILIILAGVIITESSVLTFMTNDSNQTNKQFDNLQQEHEDLQKAFSDLTTNYSNLEEDFEDLTEQYFDLYDLYEVESTLQIGNSLASYYDYVRQQVGPTGVANWWTVPDSDYWQQVADFAANLALHNLKKIYWPSLEPPYYDVVGEYSYETAWSIIQDVIDLIDIQPLDNSTIRIQKILTFLSQFVSYEYDVNDLFSAPVETLAYRSGDCDDYTILASALFEAVGIDTAVGLFVNDDDEYHAMVLLHLENLSSYGYWYYSDLTHRGLESGRWIIIESQIILDNQDTDFISQWSIFATSALDI